LKKVELLTNEFIKCCTDTTGIWVEQIYERTWGGTRLSMYKERINLMAGSGSAL